MLIIGLFGLSGTGKDTIAKYMTSKLGYTKISFAHILKDVVSALFSWERELLEGDTKESRIFRDTRDNWWSEKLHKEITPRLMLQQIGTELFRNHFDNNIWIYAIERQLLKYDRIVITDIRFLNEYQMIRSLNGITIKVVRDNRNKLNTSTSMHSSENNIDKFNYDFEIINNQTIEDLHHKVNSILE